MTVCASNSSVPEPVELDDLLPAEQRRLLAVPRERSASVRDPGGDEDGGPEAVVGEHGKSVLGHVEAPVVEAQPDRALGRLPAVEEIGDLADVEDPVSGRGEAVHLPAEHLGVDRELVPVCGDAVVEENPQAAPAAAARAHVPRRGAGPRHGCLDRVGQRGPDPAQIAGVRISAQGTPSRGWP